MTERDPLDLGQYVNDADIWASDTPAVVVQKLQAAINRANKANAKFELLGYYAADLDLLRRQDAERARQMWESKK